MFNTINWDTLGDLLSDIVVVGLLCVVLYIWAARVRLRDMREREAAANKRRRRPPAEDEASASPGPRRHPHP